MSNRDDLWSRYRDELFFDPQTGFGLDTSRMDLPASCFDDHRAAIARALEAMDALEKGAVANPDEQRMVGHYWLRDASLAPTPALRAQVEDTLAAVRKLADAVHSSAVKPERAERFRNVLVVGIGGSALGPQLVASALTRGSARDKARVFFFDNTDPDGFDRVLSELGAEALAETLTVVISKSGGTRETRNGMLEAAAAYARAGLEFARHAVAITGEGSELDRTAQRGAWLARLPMFDWIGGRTSQLSAVGLFPAALQGFDIDAMLRGARAMDTLTRRTDAKQNPALRMALAWFHATEGRGAKDMVVLPYKDRFELFSRYLQQLVMESLGKEHDLDGKTVHQGIAVYGNKGSTDQHAYVQQLRDGVPNFFVTFLEVLQDRTEPDAHDLEVEPNVTSGDYLLGFLEGTRKALYEAGRRSMTVTLPRADAHAVGMLIALYERAVGFYASLINVNAYHQPGVEAGKKAAGDVLALQARVFAALRAATEPLEVEAIARAAEGDPETVFKILRHLAANPHRGVRAEGDAAQPLAQRYALAAPR